MLSGGQLGISIPKYRDIEAKRVDKPKKDITKETPKTEEKKQATA